MPDQRELSADEEKRRQVEDDELHLSDGWLLARLGYLLALSLLCTVPRRLNAMVTVYSHKKMYRKQ